MVIFTPNYRSNGSHFGNSSRLRLVCRGKTKYIYSVRQKEKGGKERILLFCYTSFLFDFVLQLCTFSFFLHSFASQVLFSVAFTRIKALLHCLQRTEMILEASEKISTKSSRYTMLALVLLKKHFQSPRIYKKPNWLDLVKSWSNECRDSLLRKVSP